MFNMQSNRFFTVLVKTYDQDCFEQSSHIFESKDEAIYHIQDNSSWDCRPSGGSTDEWYDAGSGRTYRIVSCAECDKH